MKPFLVFFIVLFFFIGSNTQCFAWSKGNHMFAGIVSTLVTITSLSVAIAHASIELGSGYATKEEEDKASNRAAIWMLVGIGTGIFAVDQFNKALDPDHESTHKTNAILNFDETMRLISVRLPALTLTSHREGMLKIVSIGF